MMAAAAGVAAGEATMRFSAPHSTVPSSPEPHMGSIFSRPVTVEVRFEDYKLDRKYVEVLEGSSVRWVNPGTEEVRVMANQGGDILEPLALNLPSRGSAEYAFKKVGTYMYNLQPYSYVAGSVKVKPAPHRSGGAGEATHLKGRISPPLDKPGGVVGGRADSPPQSWEEVIGEDEDEDVKPCVTSSLCDLQPVKLQAAGRADYARSLHRRTSEWAAQAPGGSSVGQEEGEEEEEVGELCAARREEKQRAMLALGSPVSAPSPSRSSCEFFSSAVVGGRRRRPVSSSSVSEKCGLTMEIGSPAPQAVICSMEDFSFSPETLVIQAGGSVTWTLGHGGTHGSEEHQIVGSSHDAPELNFEGPLMGRGGAMSFTQTMPVAGTVHFKCSVYEDFMRGTVIVRNPSASSKTLPAVLQKTNEVQYAEKCHPVTGPVFTVHFCRATGFHPRFIDDFEQGTSLKFIWKDAVRQTEGGQRLHLAPYLKGERPSAYRPMVVLSAQPGGDLVSPLVQMNDLGDTSFVDPESHHRFHAVVVPPGGHSLNREGFAKDTGSSGFSPNLDADGGETSTSPTADKPHKSKKKKKNKKARAGSAASALPSVQHKVLLGAGGFYPKRLEAHVGDSLSVSLGNKEAGNDSKARVRLRPRLHHDGGEDVVLELRGIRSETFPLAEVGEYQLVGSEPFMRGLVIVAPAPHPLEIRQAEAEERRARQAQEELLSEAASAALSPAQQKRGAKKAAQHSPTMVNALEDLACTPLAVMADDVELPSWCCHVVPGPGEVEQARSDGRGGVILFRPLGPFPPRLDLMCFAGDGALVECRVEPLTNGSKRYISISQDGPNISKPVHCDLHNHKTAVLLPFGTYELTDSDTLEGAIVCVEPNRLSAGLHRGRSSSDGSTTCAADIAKDRALALELANQDAREALALPDHSRPCCSTYGTPPVPEAEPAPFNPANQALFSAALVSEDTAGLSSKEPPQKKTPRRVRQRRRSNRRDSGTAEHSAAAPADDDTISGWDRAPDPAGPGTRWGEPVSDGEGADERRQQAGPSPSWPHSQPDNFGHASSEGLSNSKRKGAEEEEAIAISFGNFDEPDADEEEKGTEASDELSRIRGQALLDELRAPRGAIDAAEELVVRHLLPPTPFEQEVESFLRGRWDAYSRQKNIRFLVDA
jgi:plastocyanin